MISRLLIPAILLSSTSWAAPATASTVISDRWSIFAPTAIAQSQPQLKFAKDYLIRGKNYRESENYEAALADFNKAIEIDPNLAEAYYQIGATYQQQEKYDLALSNFARAIDKFELVIKASPNYHRAYDSIITAHNNRGNIYFEQGKDDLALAELELALKITHPLTAPFPPSNPKIRTYSLRGLIYERQGKEDLALADYDKAIEFNPYDSLPYFRRGLIYTRQGKEDLALADYNKIIEFNPDFVPAYYSRGLIYEGQGKEDLALADYNKAIEFNPDFAPAYGNRGNIYKNQGKNDLARTDWENAKQLFQTQGDMASAEQLDNILRQLP